MRRIIAMLVLVLPMIVAAQGLDVANFYLNERDLTALNEATKELDDNGQVSALIKVETTQKGFVFEAGTIGIVKVDESQVGVCSERRKQEPGIYILGQQQYR